MSQLNENTLAEFKGQLIDTLEDYLTEEGVAPSMLPNEDRDDEDECSAIIYGEHYGMLEDSIQHELDIYNLVGRENPISNPQIIAMTVSHIFEGYQELMDMIDTFKFNDDDERRLKQEIRQTFVNWEVFA